MPILNSDDVLAHSIIALKVFKEASSAISAVPALSAIIGVVLGIIEAAEKIKENKELCSQIKSRAIALGDELQEDFEDYRSARDPGLDAQLAEMLSTLETIRTDLAELTLQRTLSRWAHYGSTRNRLGGHLKTVDQIAHTYVRTMLRTLRNKAWQQAIYTEDQLRYFRHCDLELQYRSSLFTNPNIYSEQWSAKYNGRAVAVRYLRPGEDIKDILNKTLGKSVRLHNQHLIQYLGLSHPDITQPFVVLETGGIDAAQYFRSSCNIQEKLRCFLQMYIDWENLFRYVTGEGLRSLPDDSLHIHSPECLSSLSIRRRGDFVVSAEDLRHASFSCMRHHLRTALNGKLLRSYSEVDHGDQDYHTGPQDMIQIVEHTPQPTMVDFNAGGLSQPRLPQIWSSRWVKQRAHATVGDYGYTNSHSAEFVCLGNILDILKRERPTSWRDWTYANGIPQTMEEVDVTSGRVRRYDTEPGKQIGHTMRSELLGNALESFWWLHACGVAHRFELPLERLVLGGLRLAITYSFLVGELPRGAELIVSSISFSCDISTDPITDTNNHPTHLPNTYHFHQLALMESGEMPSPFGYWSLDAESSPGPWPEMSIAGVKLRCWQEVRYSYLSPMQAQLVGYFWDCLQAAGPQLSFFQPHMTEIHAELDRDDDKRSKLYATYVDGVDEEGYGDLDSTSSECEFADEDAGTK